MKTERCVDCGKTRDQITGTAWYHPNGFQCDPCRVIMVDNQIVAFQKSEKSTKYTDNLTCPHCGNEENDSWEVEPDSGERECGNCNREYFYERQMTVEYITLPSPPTHN